MKLTSALLLALSRYNWKSPSLFFRVRSDHSLALANKDTPGATCHAEYLEAVAERDRICASVRSYIPTEVHAIESALSARVSGIIGEALARALPGFDIHEDDVRCRVRVCVPSALRPEAPADDHVDYMIDFHGNGQKWADHVGRHLLAPESIDIHVSLKQSHVKTEEVDTP